MARHPAIVAFARFNEPSLSIGTIYKKREPFRRCARLRDTSTVAYVEKLKRFRYGPCAFKIDYAVSCPIPWTASECSRAATVHTGGSLEGIIEAERTLDSERVCVILGQHFSLTPLVRRRGATLHGLTVTFRMAARLATPKL
jgi:hypothetical protein